jgi:hypothetical protein
MAEKKLYRVELRVTTTFHVDVAAESDGEAKKLARAQVEKGECFPATPHKLTVKIVAVDELQVDS